VYVTDRAGAVLRDPLIRWADGSLLLDLTGDCGLFYVRGRDKRTCWSYLMKRLSCPGASAMGRVHVLAATGRATRRAFDKRYVKDCWAWDCVIEYGFILDARGAYVEQSVPVPDNV
jgi:hypothetical protein